MNAKPIEMTEEELQEWNKMWIELSKLIDKILKDGETM